MTFKPELRSYIGGRGPEDSGSSEGSSAEPEGGDQ